ncbi:MAG TPA: allantoinase AllB [Thermoanaerobaculia bacterium]|nr:allantoinase AllB [Thermoanaerobaculia bacterium]
MKGADLVLRSTRVATPSGLEPAAVVVRDGVVVAVERPGTAGIDYGDAVVMPGLVDTHVHVNEPGRTGWEGFETATRAAAAGGVTTIFDMPLNSIPPTTTVAALEEKAAAARGRVSVDVGFWGGVVPGNRGELAALAARGVPGFKCFLVPSGVAEFGHVSEEDLRDALPEIARLHSVLLVHAEHPDWIGEPPPRAGGRLYSSYLATRPARAEDEAVAQLARLCRETGARIHVVHLSSAGALGTIARARAEGLPLSAETCPHYLSFSAEEVPDGATEWKCAPPIRGADNRERLWEGLAKGTIEIVVSDHSPAPPELKRRDTGDFLAAWGGISSLQLRLPAVWTGARARGFSPGDLARWLCSAPARLAGLARKGAIAPGSDADFVVWRPEASFAVRAGELHHRHALTPYAGRTLHGVVEATYLAGEKIFEGGRFHGPPRGKILLESEARP